MLRAALLSALLFNSVSGQCSSKLEWTTSAGQVLANGQPLVLKGINYFGFETETYTPHGIWSYDLNYYLNFIKNNSFNAIRVPFSMEMVRNNPTNLNINCANNTGLCGLSALQLLDVFIDRAAERGLLIMLDNHRITPGGGISDLWYNSAYTEAQVIALWQTLVTRYANRWNVFAIDLKNEPHDSASWGNSNTGTDWNKAAERMINGLSSFAGLYFVEGIEWGNRLENVAQYPINTGNATLNKRVVYSPHCYGPSVYDRPEFNTADYPNNLEAIYMAKYGFIVNATGQPVIVGEWGGQAQTGTRDATWNNWYVEFLRGKCLTNNFYWCLNPNSGDTGGLLEDDWLTPIPRKINLTNRAQPNPTKFSYTNGQICITPGAFPEKRCQAAASSSSTAAPAATTTTKAATAGSTTPTKAISAASPATTKTVSSTTTAAPATNTSTKVSTTTSKAAASTAKSATSTTAAPATSTSTEASSTTTKATTAAVTTPSVSGGVTASVTLVKSWVENGTLMRQYTLRLTNGSGAQVCSVQVKLNATLSQKWNLEEVSTDLYKTPSWMVIAVGGYAEQAGYIASTTSTPQVVSYTKC